MINILRNGRIIGQSRPKVSLLKWQRCDEKNFSNNNNNEKEREDEYKESFFPMGRNDERSFVVSITFNKWQTRLEEKRLQILARAISRMKAGGKGI
jgi:hypothetical protein